MHFYLSIFYFRNLHPDIFTYIGCHKLFIRQSQHLTGLFRKILPRNGPLCTNGHLQKRYFFIFLRIISDHWSYQWPSVVNDATISCIICVLTIKVPMSASNSSSVFKSLTSSPGNNMNTDRRSYLTLLNSFRPSHSSKNCKTSPQPSQRIHPLLFWYFVHWLHIRQERQANVRVKIKYATLAGEYEIKTEH